MDPIQQQNLQEQIDTIKSDKAIIEHVHNGFDTSRILWDDIYTKRMYIPYTIPGTSAATSGNYSSFFIAPFPCVVSGFKEVHAVAGTDGGTVTVMLEKLTGTTAPGSGTSLLNSALSLKTSANTVQAGTLTTTVSNRSLAINDRVALKSTGALTSVTNVSVIIEIIVV